MEEVRHTIFQFAARSNHHSAVDLNHSARRVRTGIGGQEDSGPDEFVDATDPPQGRCLDGPCENILVLPQRATEVCLDQAR